MPEALGRRRSPAQWVLRGIAACAIAALGYGAVTRSLALSMLDRDPEQAFRLTPGDARIAAGLSQRLILGEPGLEHRGREEALAISALRRDPTAVRAVATLGLLADSRGDTATARRLFAYSDRLSRRDLVSRLWLIENAVERGDTAEALRHYDIALRTDSAAPGVLFPVLAEAVGDRAIAGELVRVLRRRPPWSNAFVMFVAGRSSDPQAVAWLFSALRAARYPVPAKARASLVDALVVRGKFAAAWRFYSAGQARSDPRMSRDPDFMAVDEAPTRFDWIVMNSANGISVALQRNGREGELDFFVPATASGLLASQLQVLPPGSYRLDGSASTSGQAGKPVPYWTLRCVPDGRELGRVDLPGPGPEIGRFAARFTVPADCPAQSLELVARGPDDPAGVTGRIRQARLRPAVQAAGE